jgi:hypothetical protein
MIHLMNLDKIPRFAALSFGVALTILVSSCAQIPLMSSENPTMAAKEVEDAKAADEKAHTREAREFKKEAQKEKVEDKDFAAMRKQLEKDEAMAESSSGQAAVVSRLFFDKEMLAMNERVHAISKRVEELSERMHETAQRVEKLPEKLAELKLELVTAEENIRKTASRPKALMQAAGPVRAPFWGIQIGAYKTKAGAKVSWAEFLSDPMAIELTDAKVRYVQTKPLKNGKRLTLIIVNEYPNRKAAEAACNGLKGRGLDCVAYHVRP